MNKMTKLKVDFVELAVFAIMNILAIGSTSFVIVALIEYFRNTNHPLHSPTLQ